MLLYSEEMKGLLVVVLTNIDLFAPVESCSKHPRSSSDIVCTSFQVTLNAGVVTELKLQGEKVLQHV